MKRKAVTVLLGFAMLASLLAGCGKEAGGEDSGSTAEQAGDIQEETSGEPAHITVEVFDRGDMPAEYGTPTDNQWTRMIQEAVKEELNIEVEFVAIPRSEETTKMSALIAAGQEPDIFVTYDANFYTTWAEDGALADLAPYLDNEGKDVKEYLEAVLPYGQMDGAQYALNARRIGLGNSGTFIRKDWLDQLGIAVQERNGVASMTPSELMEALVKMKEAGLCEYPMGMIGKDNTLLTITPLLYAFLSDEDMENGESCALASQDRALITVDGAKEGYQFLNECYNKGLFNPDFVLYDQSDLGEWVASEQCGFWAANSWSFLKEGESIPALYEANPEAEAMAVEICQEDGTPANRFCYAPKGAYLMVSSECENVSAAVKYLNWLVSEEAHILAWHGIQGEHWEYDENNVMVVKDADYNAGTRMNVRDLDILLHNDPCLLEGEHAVKNDAVNLYHPDCVELALKAIEIAEYHAFIPPALVREPSAKTEWSAELIENSSNTIIKSVMASREEFSRVYDENLEIYMDEGFEEVSIETKEIFAESHSF